MGRRTKIKPHLYRVFGEWRASLGGHVAVGGTPLEAYQRLLRGLEAHRRSMDSVARFCAP